MPPRRKRQPTPTPPSDPPEDVENESVEIEDDVEEEDIEADEDQQQEQDGEEDNNSAEDMDIESEADDEPEPTPPKRIRPPLSSSKPKVQPRLKIKLKIPSKLQSNSNSTDGTPTPAVTPVPLPAKAGGRKKRLTLKRRISSRDLEEVAKDEEKEKDELESEENVPESEEGDPISSDDEAAILNTSRLTQRQAALAGGLEISHVELDGGVGRKKKVLNETELALRREETARKRKNLSEKKLEDEKVETINRLLRKQSTRRKNATAAANTQISTPAQNEDSDVDSTLQVESRTTAETSMYRWVSGPSGTSFSVPKALISSHLQASSDEHDKAGEPTVTPNGLPSAEPNSELKHTAVDSNSRADSSPARPISICDVPGCPALRKYRLVKNFDHGACCMGHLKILQKEAETLVPVRG